MAEKKERKVTPEGEAKWAHIHKPKAPYVGKDGATKGEPKYQIDVLFNPDDPAWKTWTDDIRATLQSMPKQVDKKTGNPIPQNTPIKRELDENDEPTGRLYATFKTSAKFSPGVFDVYGNRIPKETLIGNGSKVRVSYIENHYDGLGGGINFYLNAVQVIDLVEYQKQDATSYGFDVQESPEWNGEETEKEPDFEQPPVEAYNDEIF